MKNKKEDCVSFEGTIARETEKAVLFQYNNSENWLPKSQINIKTKKDKHIIEIPLWLWNKMNQIENTEG